MTKIVVDASTLHKLGGLGERLELCDEAGRTLGFFYPALQSDELSEEDRRGPFSDEELERRRQDRTGRSLDEILDELERS